MMMMMMMMMTMALLTYILGYPLWAKCGVGLILKLVTVLKPVLEADKISR